MGGIGNKPPPENVRIENSPQRWGRLPVSGFGALKKSAR